MNVRFFTSLILLLSSWLMNTKASALTVEQFSAICASASGDCSDLPVIQTYVGGALDLLATLDEQTDYLNKLYCKEPKELFKVPDIVSFMQQQPQSYTNINANSNAMLLLIRYFEQHGGCKR